MDVAGVDGVIGSLELEPPMDEVPPDIRFVLRDSQVEDEVVVAGDSVVGEGDNGSLWMIASHFFTACDELPGILAVPLALCFRSNHSCTSVTSKSDEAMR